MPKTEANTALPFANRIQSFREQLAQTRRVPVDAALISNRTNIGYLSGFRGSTAMLLISPTEAIIITDGRYLAQAAIECPNYAIVEAKSSGGYSEALASTLKERPAIGRLGFESGTVTVDQLKQWRKDAAKADAQARFVPGPKIAEDLRKIKSADEIELIREAVRIAEGAFERVRENIKAGVSERDFGLELEFTMRRMGADAPSFDSIVASGPNGAHPHHGVSDRIMEAGDLVTIDWGARKNGYCSDITRTVAVPGKPVDETLAKLHAIVLEAKVRSTEACLAGANGKDVDAIARQIIIDAGYGDDFKHSLGHGLGRDVHDGMTLSQRSDKITLKPGMVTTIEPGIYVNGLGGIRIEEDVLITENGPVVLTTPSPALID